MKLLIPFFLLVISGSAAPALRCRVVAIAGARVVKAPWRSGLDGCQAAVADAKAAVRFFGDEITYKVQIQSAGKSIFYRIVAPDSGDASGPVQQQDR